ncbi:MAG: SHOCT domain-containing protein [Geminicoccaceae bacterium]
MELTSEGRRLVEEVAQRHGVSGDAVLTLLMALAAGHGTAAQFSHPDLGGMGQWSQGGMLMIGDMFNNALKYKVDQLCNELSAVVRSQGWAVPASSQSQSQGPGPRSFQSQSQGGGGLGQQSQGGGLGQGVSLFVPGAGGPGNWWPAELGAPSSVGAQNDVRYACFPATRRLAIQLGGGEVRVFDTGDHQISGFSQQQSGDASLTFTSQHGVVRVADLPRVGAGEPAPRAAAVPPPVVARTPAAVPAPPPVQASPSAAAAEPVPAPPAGGITDDEVIFARIERLAELKQKGILTEEEFAAKKAELLGRL